MKKGTRCTICTGCGRCFGEYEERTHILSLSDAYKNKVSLEGPVICTDIGTTTIAMIAVLEDGSIADSYSVLNPQGKHGADVLSRIKAAKDTAVLDEMKGSVRKVLEDGIKKFERSIALPDTVKMYVSANTTMTYLLMGYDPSELGEAPFKASHLSGEVFSLQVGKINADVTVLPGFSAFVGSDIYAGIIASKLCTSEKYRLLLDLGTNGEIALGNKDHLFVTATAAGPAFEGGPCKGIRGADMIHITAALLEENLIDETGLLSEKYFEDGITAGNVYITQESIRALQLAKGAMNAGIKMICDKAGISFSDIEECILAGGFGYFLKPEDAARIGLLPEKLADKTRSGGNTALEGALRFAEGSRVTTGAVVINLAENPSFNDLYTGSLNFPNN